MSAAQTAGARSSALYEGVLEHRRHGPRPHAFRYRAALPYLDLDELPELFRGRLLWSLERPNLVSFRRADYLGDPRVPLARAVRDRVEEELGRRPAGPVRMAGGLRQLGHGFNPVVFYYCFDAAGADLDAVVAEITNTPWGERRSHVLDAAAAARPGADELVFRFAKDFHVSPFFEMELDYAWTFRPPGERLEVRMESLRGGALAFDASLSLERRPWTAATLARTLARHPLGAAGVHLAIYWQALLLLLKRAPFHAHPAKRAEAPARP